MVPPVLHLQLLGVFRLVHGHVPVTSINTLRLQSLLAYLVLHRTARESRQQLAFLFWPNSSESQARTNLRNLFHLLRQALPNPDLFLFLDGQTVQWRSDAPFTADVIQFETAAAQLSSAQSLQAAIDLYHGDLLTGCYADWILPERERLRQIFVETLDQLIVLFEHQGDFHSAISYSERLLRYDPLREDTYRQLMRLHILSGDHASAVRVFQTCVAVMKRELGIDVSALTLEAYKRLMKTESPSVSVAEFTPKLRSHNLPVHLTNFIGRKREIADLKQLLMPVSHSDGRAADGEKRLITLTGAGGCGKTRLAIEVAKELLDAFTDGVWLVELTPIADPTLVPMAVATTLDVHEMAGRSLTAVLIDYLWSKQLLLILDNCEHLLSASAQLVTELLQACPNLRILATSVERLKVAGETVWQVPTLSVPRMERPASTEELNQSEAVQLFIDRAVSALPTFTFGSQQAAMVVKICQHLDGIALAIELAAARIKMLTIEQIVERLDDRFRLLIDGGRITVTKHQTLRAAMDWSHQLLSFQEQVFFRRLSVFVGSFTLEAAAQVCTDQSTDGEQPLDLLASLTDKSLVLVDRSDTVVRFRLLETIRAYAREKLIESGELDRIRHRHLEFFRDLAERVEPELLAEKQSEWIRRLEREHDNLREALEWSKVSMERQMTVGADGSEEGLRLAGALWRFWNGRYPSEGREQLRGLLLRVDGSHQTTHLAKAIAVFADLSYRQGNYISSFMAFDESLAIWRDVDDKRGIAFSLRGLGNVHLARGNLALARSLYEQSLQICHEMGDRNGLAFCLSNLGLVAWNEGDYVTARKLMEESLNLRREMGDPGGIAYVLNLLGTVASSQGDYTAARQLNEESLAIKRELNDRWGIAYALDGLGMLAAVEGDHTLARARFTESLMLFQELGDKWGMIGVLERFSSLASAQAHSLRAVRLYGAVEALRRTLGLVRSAAECVEYERTMIALHAQPLDEVVFLEEWLRGRAMSLEQAIEYALAVSN